MENLEKKIINDGYKLINEDGPFKVYGRGEERILYHSIGMIWRKYRLKDRKQKPKHLNNLNT